MLSVGNLRKRFGPVEALAGCSFTVERGQMCGFLGPTGGGTIGGGQVRPNGRVMNRTRAGI